MSDARPSFDQAVEDIKQLKARPGNDALLELYALYKQGTRGDAASDRPGFFDFVGTAKHAAWMRLRGMDRASAQSAYVALVRRLLAD
jgi:acyl-CoA-binding protein